MARAVATARGYYLGNSMILEKDEESKKRFINEMILDLNDNSRY